MYVMCTFIRTRECKWARGWMNEWVEMTYLNFREGWLAHCASPAYIQLNAFVFFQLFCCCCCCCCLFLCFFSITHSNTIGRFLRQKKTWFHAEFARTTDVMVNTIMYGKLTVRVWHRVVKHKILCSETTPGPGPSFSMIQDFTQGIFH